MVEKFGKLVQLEKLEGAIVNLQIEELKQRLDDAGDDYYNTMAQYEVQTFETGECQSESGPRFLKSEPNKKVFDIN